MTPPKDTAARRKMSQSRHAAVRRSSSWDSSSWSSSSSSSSRQLIELPRLGSWTSHHRGGRRVSRLAYDSVLTFSKEGIVPSGTDYLEFLIGQRQTREFTDEPVSDADIQALLETMRWTGSASNRQPWQFMVVRDAGEKAALAGATQYTGWIVDAPLL